MKLNKLSGYAFTGLLGNYLDGRKSCPKHSNKLKGLSQFTRAAVPNSVSSSIDNSSSENDAKKSTPAGAAN